MLVICLLQSCGRVTGMGYATPLPDSAFGDCPLVEWNRAPVGIFNPHKLETLHIKAWFIVDCLELKINGEYVDDN